MSFFLKKILKKRANVEILKSISTLASGSAISQIILFLTVPVLTRLYSPSEYGVQGVYISVVTILSAVITLNYHQAIPLTIKQYQLKNVLKISFYIGLFLSISLCLLCFIFQSEIADLSGIENKSIVFLFPIGALLLSLVLTLELLCYKFNLFGLQAKTHVFFSLGLQALKIGGGYLHAFGITLICSILVSYIAKISVLLFKLRKKVNVLQVVKAAPILRDVKVVLKKYESLPLHRMPQTFVSSLAMYLPIFVLASYFSIADSGQYSLAIGVLGVPLTLLGSAITNVLFPKISTLFNDNHKEMYTFVCKFTLVMIFFLVLPLGVFSYYADLLFMYIFGEIWEQAGVFAGTLCLQYYFIIALRPIVVCITVINKNKFYLYFELISALFKLIVIYLVISYELSAEDLVLNYVYASSFMSILLICWFFVLQKPKRINSGFC